MAKKRRKTPKTSAKRKPLRAKVAKSATRKGREKRARKQGVAIREVLPAERPECLEPDDAIALLEHCLGNPLPDLDTPLSDLFPSDESRRQFCRCIADGVSRAFPCKGTTTLQDIVDAISC